MMQDTHSETKVPTISEDKAEGVFFEGAIEASQLDVNAVRIKLMDWVLMLILSTRARRVLGLLAQMCRHDPNDPFFLRCYPSQKTIAAKLGISVRSVSYAVQELKQKELIEVKLIRTSLGKDKIRHELTVYKLKAPFSKEQQGSESQVTLSKSKQESQITPSKTPNGERVSKGQKTAKKPTLSKTQESLGNVAFSKSVQESQVLPPKTPNGAPVSKTQESLGNVASHNESFKTKKNICADAHASKEGKADAAKEAAAAVPGQAAAVSKSANRVSRRDAVSGAQGRKERANVARIRAKHDAWLLQRRDRISRRLDQLQITNENARAFCLNPEYIDHIESELFARYHDQANDPEGVLHALRLLRDYNLPARRSKVIDDCLTHLDEKGVFADSAIKTVFRNPYLAWDIIGGCNWEYTNGRQLASKLGGYSVQ